uniref:Csy1 n=1 Tax=Arundo donax TaxID=35708 RepID=A0A0A8ZCV9_ARUDO
MSRYMIKQLNQEHYWMSSSLQVAWHNFADLICLSLHNLAFLLSKLN